MRPGDICLILGLGIWIGALFVIFLKPFVWVGTLLFGFGLGRNA
jgi:hypothetical protein